MLLIFFLLWVIFSAGLSVEITVLGVVISALVYGFCVRHLGYGLAADKRIVRKFFQGLRYVWVLVRETVKANMEVSRFVYARRIQVEPQLVFFKTDLKSDTAKVALANSITLTPGTITVAINDDQFCVHCLNSHMAEGIDDLVFSRLLRQMEEE